MIDFYDVLGVPATATQDEIHTAYRSLVKTCHPDLHPDKADDFRQLTEAHDVLSDPDQRAQYDNGEISSDPEKNETLKMARHNVESIIDAICNELQDLNSQDPLPYAFTRINQNIEGQANFHRQLESRKHKLETLQKRLTRRKGVDFLRLGFERKLKAIDQDLKAVAKNCDMWFKARDFLATYEYQRDGVATAWKPGPRTAGQLYIPVN